MDHVVVRSAWNNQFQEKATILTFLAMPDGTFKELAPFDTGLDDIFGQNEVRAIHSYETPEIIALPIVAGSADYLKWLTSSLEGS